MVSSHWQAVATSILQLRRRPPIEALTIAAFAATDPEFPLRCQPALCNVLKNKKILANSAELGEWCW
ncbi:hypothetical protein MRB53_032775 [Persea americana]|uniref:Uncharacterized protein n=1 Tax=Persea americana TaxID=3435 RepID=A0ACC2KTC4_PERAE|nr:hypothetical protein MRB53_032775 [Persea americana]